MAEGVGGISGKMTRPVLFCTNQQSTGEGGEQLHNNTRHYLPARATDGWDEDDEEGESSLSSKGVVVLCLEEDMKVIE